MFLKLTDIIIISFKTNFIVYSFKILLWIEKILDYKIDNRNLPSEIIKYLQNFANNYYNIIMYKIQTKQYKLYSPLAQPV